MNDTVHWIDPHDPPRGADRKWLTVFATCVIDGYYWRISKSGKSYCAGKDLIKEGVK